MRGTTYTSIEALSALDSGGEGLDQASKYDLIYGGMAIRTGRLQEAKEETRPIGGTVGAAASQAESLAPPSPSPYHGGSMCMLAGRSSLKHGKLLHATKV
ncbi:hypothetical protein GGP41_006863 [Bipolaris sorokiniana]|uniref:Uncharacterized protein n=1 Tax=Cochliobolus sativus TaxID=45130 RepID=A0A8H6DZT0_COCSA|nr:hypothetical protein GGP41_006863 [Bipolaris sorokiniana]